MTRLTECIDYERLECIIKNFKPLFEGNHIKAFVDPKMGYSRITDMSSCLTILNNFKKAHPNGRGDIHYTQVAGYNGRRHGRNSLQGIHRSIRHTLARGTMTDLDIVNAHPVILQHYCINNNITCDYLTEYINDRDAIIYNVMESDNCSRDDAKIHFLSIINGAYPKSGNFFITNFFEEMKNIHQLVTIRNPALLALALKKIEKKRQEFNKLNIDKFFFENLNGTVVNMMMCEAENNILSIMEESLKTMNIRVATLCFDGVLIYKKHSVIADICKKVSDDIYEHEGIRVEIKEKIMDEFLADEIIGYEQKVVEVISDEVEFPSTDEEQALYVLNEMKDMFLYSRVKKELYIYSETSCLWVRRDTKCFGSYASVILVKLFESLGDNKEVLKEIKKVRSNSKQNALIHVIDRLIESNECYDMTDIIQDKIDKKRDCLPIVDNKVIDFETLQVRERVKDDYFTTTTNNTYKTDINPYVFEYFKQILKTDDLSYVSCFIQICGYWMTGRNSMKKLFVMKGLKDSGKSLFLKVIGKIFKSFSVIANKKVFIQSKNEAVHNAEMFPLVNKRIACLSEVDANLTFNENWIKGVTGNDSIQSIRQPGGIEGLYTVNPSLLLLCNNIPNFTDEAFQKRLLLIHFPEVFSENQAVEDKIMGISDDIFSAMCIGAHLYILNGIQLVEQMKISTQEILDEQDSFKQFMEEEIDIVYNNDQIDTTVLMKRPDLQQRYELFCRPNQFTPIGRTTIFRRLKNDYKIESKRERFFSGIRFKDDDSDLL